MQVSLEETWRCANARLFLENLYPMYVHELSAYGADFYALDGHGRWQPDLARHWSEPVTARANLLEPRSSSDPAQPFQRGYVICAEQRRVGFACVAQKPFRYMREGSDFQLAELFLGHAHRGTGVAVLAVQKLFGLFRGRWELSALRDNTRAVAFWRAALPRLGARSIDTLELGGEVVSRFTIV